MTYIAKCQSYEESLLEPALYEAIEGAGGLDWVKEGMHVVVKPNLIMKKHPDAACTTHPTIIKLLCRMLIERGARVTVGDSPGGIFAKNILKQVYEGTLMTEIEQTGAELNWDTEGFTDYYEDAKVLKSINAVRFIEKADAVISVAKLKTHGMMGYTGAVKNLFGLIPGTVKAEYHYRFNKLDEFANMLIDLCEYIKPKLSIIDGIIGMEGEGPTHGTPRAIGVIIASQNPHHADLAGAHLIGLSKNDVPTLNEAEKRGLLAGYEAKGADLDSLIVHDFKTMDVMSNENVNFKFLFSNVRYVEPMIRKIMRPFPKVDKKLCIGCGECKRCCPPQAITMEDKLPHIDSNKCIYCFCCQELCPKAAMKIHKHFIAKILSPKNGARRKNEK